MPPAQGRLEILRKALKRDLHAGSLELDQLSDEDLLGLAKNVPLFRALLITARKHGKLEDFAFHILRPLLRLQVTIPLDEEMEVLWFQLINPEESPPRRPFLIRVASALALLFSTKPTLEESDMELHQSFFSDEQQDPPLRLAYLELFTILVSSSSNKGCAKSILTSASVTLRDPKLLAEAACQPPNPFDSNPLKALPEDTWVASTLRFLREYARNDPPWTCPREIEELLVNCLGACLKDLAIIRRSSVLLGGALGFVATLAGWSQRAKEAVSNFLEFLCPLLEDGELYQLALVPLSLAVAGDEDRQQRLASIWSPQTFLPRVRPSPSLLCSQEPSHGVQVNPFFASLGDTCRDSVPAQFTLLEAGVLNLLDLSFPGPNGDQAWHERGLRGAFHFLRDVSPGIFHLCKMQDPESRSQLEAILLKLLQKLLWGVGRGGDLSLDVEILRHAVLTGRLHRLPPLLPPAVAGSFDDPQTSKTLSFFLSLGIREEVALQFLGSKTQHFIERQGEVKLFECFLVHVTHEVPGNQHLTTVTEHFSLFPFTDLPQELIAREGLVATLVRLASARLNNPGFLYSSFAGYPQDRWIPAQVTHEAAKRIYVASRAQWSRVDERCNNPHQGHPLLTLRMEALEAQPGAEIYYHGTSVEDAESIIRDGILLDACSPRSDFSASPAFYVTRTFSFARDWALMSSSSVAILAFVLDRETLQALPGKVFTTPSPEWGEFIRTRIGSRGSVSDPEGFHWIQGPVSKNPWKIRNEESPAVVWTENGVPMFQLAIRDRDLAQALSRGLEGVVTYAS